MKKRLISLSLLASLCCTGWALAANNPFSDVPAKHWAYGAVSKLAKDGIVNGNNGRFDGDSMMSRYEMAVIVGNAMTKADKASAEDKELINKLAAEFSDELKAMDKRVDAVEKKTDELKKNQSKLKVDGFFQERSEHLSNPINNNAAPDSKRKVLQRTAILLNISNQFDGDTYFHGMLWSENFPGISYQLAGQNEYLQVHEAFVAKKVGDGTEVAVGMFFPTIGRGTLMSTPMMDGGRLSYKNDKVKVNLYSTTFRGDWSTWAPTGVHYDMGDITYNLNKNFDISLAAVHDKGVTTGGPVVGNSIYRQTAVGAEYRGISNITLTAEYGKNASDVAKSANNGDDAAAYFLKAKYKGANPFVPGSSGFHVEYKKADPNFDMFANAGPQNWNSVFNKTAGAGGGSADNIKGFEYGFETTIAPRTIFSVAYDKVKQVSDNRDYSYLTAQIFYLF